MRLSTLLLSSLFVGLAVSACDANSNNNTFGGGSSDDDDSGGSAGSSGSSSNGGNAGSGGSGASINTGAAAGTAGVAPANCNDPDPDSDNDNDGWTENQGDCNDCDPNSNPGAVDVINYKKDANGVYVLDTNGNKILADAQIDEDCDGTALTTSAPACDGNLQPGAVGNPLDAAQAMGLCNVGVEENPADPKNKKWGVIKAQFNHITGPFFATPLQMDAGKIDITYGILPNFGNGSKPQEGLRLFAISSGQARANASQPGFIPSSFGGNGDTDVIKTSCNSNAQCQGVGASCEPAGLSNSCASDTPEGFPKAGTGSCGSGNPVGKAFDGAALDVQIRVPTNAKSMSFKFRFMTREYPDYACSQYFDTFAVLMDPYPGGATSIAQDPMWPDIAYEERNENGQTIKNVIGVNNQSFMKVCDGSEGQGYDCSKGPGDLDGTLLEGAGASLWLQTSVPVTPGSIVNLRIAIWDTSDPVLDSTALVDGFEFSADEGSVGTVVIDDPIE